MNHIIEADRLTKEYDDVSALRDVTFSLEKGKCLVLLGPNGAGKTTLVEILEGIISRTAGAVRLFGLEPAHLECKKRIGVQTETGAFESELKVIEILRLYSSFYDKAVDCDELLSMLGLSEKRNSFFGQLSKGMKQKVAIGVALINNPEILFLDEPTSGLDIESRKDLWEIIQAQKRKGTTIVLTTHDILEAGALADEIIVLSKGIVKTQGSVMELFNDFPSRRKVEYLGESVSHESVRGFVSIANRQILYTDDTESVIGEVKKIAGNNIIESDITLEDIYLYHQKVSL